LLVAGEEQATARAEARTGNRRSFDSALRASLRMTARTNNGLRQAKARTDNGQEQKQIPPLRYGMTNKKNRQRQGQGPIRRFWLRQNDDLWGLRQNDDSRWLRQNDDLWGLRQNDDAGTAE